MPAKPRTNSLLPTGPVTFLFTDIEGSTRAWDQHPDAMRTALARHDALLRFAVESSRGCIVKSMGDGVCAVFAAASDALAASLAAQRAFQSDHSDEPSQGTAAPNVRLPFTLKIRMGLHSGSAELRDGDYFGISVNRAARIMAAAHGEQILLSATTAEALCNQLPEGVNPRQIGELRLKGVLAPERVLQVVAPGLRTDFPGLVPHNAHNLPAERDTFVGRHEFLAELSRHMDTGARLVSVVGIGGTGKTRLATRFGWNSVGGFPGGVAFCDLSQAQSVDGIVHAVARGLDIPLGMGDPVTQIGHAIAGRGNSLVILDNFEQVTRHARETLGRWLDRATEARFLVTTREVLGLTGEEVLLLEPLPSSDAAALFLRRAESAQAGFELNVDDQAAIDPLVKLLEGLPLAIELAAARVRVMPPRTLLLRMAERFKLLSSSGGRVDRQATLRAVFDWSWNLLSLPEKSALAQLSVYEGGFSLESVEAIVDLSAHENAPPAMDVLRGQIRRTPPGSITDQKLMLEQERLCGDGTYTARAEQPRDGNQ